MSSLKDLVQESGRIAQTLIDNDGLLLEEIEKSLTENMSALPAKVDGCQAVIERLENEAEYWKAKSQEFANVAKSFENARERLREYIKTTMIANNIEEILGNDTRFALQHSKPKLVLNELLVPDVYKREAVTIIIDKEQIASDLKLGLKVEGAHLEEVYALRPYVNKTRGKRA